MGRSGVWLAAEGGGLVGGEYGNGWGGEDGPEHTAIESTEVKGMRLRVKRAESES